jgi:hypothetical protein
MLNLKDPASVLRINFQVLRQASGYQGLRMHTAQLSLFHLPPGDDAHSALDAIHSELGFTQPYPNSLAANTYWLLGKIRKGLKTAERAVLLGRHVGGADLANALDNLGLLRGCTHQNEACLANLEVAQTDAPEAGIIQTVLGLDFRSLCCSVAPQQ